MGSTIGDHCVIDGMSVIGEGVSLGADNVVSNGGSNFTVRHNTFQNSHTQTATVALYGDFAPISNVLVENNLLIGDHLLVNKFVFAPARSSLWFSNVWGVPPGIDRKSTRLNSSHRC